MCSGAMVWTKLGRLVYAASNDDLEKILGNNGGCNCSKIVFDNSFWQPKVTTGILRDESIEILTAYFSLHKKRLMHINCFQTARRILCKPFLVLVRLVTLF